MATQTMTTLPGTAPDKAVPGKKKRRLSLKRLLVLFVVLALGLGGAAYTMLPKEKVEEPPPPGPVLKLEPITLNLAEGHFLKLGLALQFDAESTAHGGQELDGSPALDIAIAQLSNLKVTDLNSSAARTQAKERLTKAIRDKYHGAVTDVYFTEFVMQ